MIFCSTENECELYSTEKHKLESGTEIVRHVHVSGDLDAFGKSVHKDYFQKCIHI